MSAVEIPGKPPRWGNASTNFYQASFTRRPGSASPEKTQRCYGSIYCNPGHYHLGTKVLNLHEQPLDKYGCKITYNLRADDQRLPRPLTTTSVQNHHSFPEPKINLYQSHHSHHTQFTMATPQRPRSAGPMIKTTPSRVNYPPVNSTTIVTQTPDPLLKSLSKAFYVTSYQQNICNQTLKGIPVHVRASSDPVVSLRSQMITPKPTPVRSSTIQTSSCHNYSSKGDILKEVFSKYPPPQPTVASLRAQRPSSATSLRVGQITNLYRKC